MNRLLRRAVVCAVLACVSIGAEAQVWAPVSRISSTIGNDARRVCIGGGADFVGCPSNSLFLSTGGLVGIGTPNPNAELDVHGTVSASAFVGDGSGLTGVIAGATDRIISGTNAATRMVAISDTGYISITQAGANSGWFDPYRGLVTLGVSATGPVSATAGYFRGRVGIGTLTPSAMLTLSEEDGDGDASLSFRSGSGTPGATREARITAASTGGGGNGHSLAFFTNDNGALPGERVRINPVGHVGIGTIAPSVTFHVSGTIRLADGGEACDANRAGAIRYTSVSTFQFCLGSGWQSLEDAAGGTNGDRIISGSSSIIAYENASLTFTVAGAQRVEIGQDGVPVFSVSGTNSNASTGGLIIRQTDTSRYGAALILDATADDGGIYALTATAAGAGGGSGNFGLYHSGYGYRIYITSPTGNVGIGHNLLNPTATLQVSGTFVVSVTGQTTTPSLVVNADGSIGIGNTGNATSRVRISEGRTDATGFTQSVEPSFRASADGSYYNIGIASTPAVFIDPGVSNSGYVYGSRSNVLRQYAGDEGRLAALTGQVIQFGHYNGTATGRITDDVRGLSISPYAMNGTIGNLYGIYITNRSTGGTITGNYFGLYQQDVNAKNYFGGRVGLGVGSPLAMLDVAGTISASNAIQVGSSSLTCGAPIAGAIRYSSTSNTLQICNSVGWVSLASTSVGAGAPNAASSTGAVQFNADGSSFGGDTNNLYWDNANKRLGIGTNTPAAHLHVSGSLVVSSTQQASDAPGLFVGTNGKVGIGTVGGSGALEVSGGAVVLEGPFDGNNRIIFKPSGSSGNTWEFYPSTDNIGLYDRTNSVYRWRMSNGGNLGIGTNNPLAKLDVGGTISATDAIQVGPSTLSCGAGILGALRYSSTSNTLQVCNSLGWVSLASGTVSAGGTNAASSTGAIQFNAANTLGGDTSNFFWDNANKRLGIGTSAPSSSLHVNGSVEVPANGVLQAFTSNRSAYGRIELYNGSTGNMTISTTFAGSDLLLLPQDKVGVGTSTPGAKLDVAGNISASGSVDVGTQVFGNSSDSVSAPTYTWTGNTNTGMFMPAANTIGFTAAGQERMRVWGANIGIGTTAPSTSLYVNGQIGGGFGAMGTSGTKDWNDISNARPGSGYLLLRGMDASNAPNPGDSSYFHPFSFEYASKDGSGQLTQFAIPYSTAFSMAQGMYVRGRYLGTWTGWYQFPVIDPTGKMGVNTNAPKASLDVVGTISASDAIQVGTSSLTCSSGITGAMRYTSATMQVCDGSSWTNVGVGMPAGTIAAFEATSCPSGWSEYTTARGRFLRGRDNGAGNDPDGTRAPGSTQADELKSHTHEVYTDNSTAYVAGAGGYRATSAGAAAPDASGATGGTETRPKNVTVTFCRYNGYASSDMTGCPTGFTQIAAQGRSLGCMQTAEEASTVASWNVAADTCFTKYGGRLPRSQEWYIAMNNYALTAETGNWEWLDDYATVTSPFDGHATVGSASISDFSYERDNNATVAYRCFIQN